MAQNPCWTPKLAESGADLGPSAEVQTSPGSRRSLPFSSARAGPPGTATSSISSWLPGSRRLRSLTPGSSRSRLTTSSRAASSARRSVPTGRSCLTPAARCRRTTLSTIRKSQGFARANDPVFAPLSTCSEAKSRGFRPLQPVETAGATGANNPTFGVGFSGGVWPRAAELVAPLRLVVAVIGKG